MPQIREYRIVLPFSVEEYRIAQLYMVAKFSAQGSEGDDGDGVEILKNEPYEADGRRGQFTHKIYHLASKLPGWLVAVIPKKALILEEKAWNSYPYCMTVLTNQYFNKMKLQLESNHLPDRGTTENSLKADGKILKKREIEFIDISSDPVDPYVEEEDPAKFKSKKTGRGPLGPGWQADCEPVMTAYKLVTVDVPYWGFGARLEKYISKVVQRKVQTEAHRKAFCWLDEWFDLEIADIRKMEDETFEKLNKIRAAKKLVRGDSRVSDHEKDDGSSQKQDIQSEANLSRTSSVEKPISRQSSLTKRLSSKLSGVFTHMHPGSRHSSGELSSVGHDGCDLFGLHHHNISDILKRQSSASGQNGIVNYDAETDARHNRSPNASPRGEAHSRNESRDLQPTGSFTHSWKPSMPQIPSAGDFSMLSSTPEITPVPLQVELATVSGGTSAPYRGATSDMGGTKSSMIKGISNGKMKGKAASDEASFSGRNIAGAPANYPEPTKEAQECLLVLDRIIASIKAGKLTQVANS